VRLKGFLLQVLLALCVGALGVLLIYAFGAGYLSGYGLWVPTPWNFLVSVVLFVALVTWAARFVRRAWSKGVEP
jgi:hypothetical protein